MNGAVPGACPALLLSRLCGDLPSELRDPLLICWKLTPVARLHTGWRHIKQTVNGSAARDVWRRNVASLQVEPRPSRQRSRCWTRLQADVDSWRMI